MTSLENVVLTRYCLQANLHETELVAIKERLDQLDEFQRAQMKELKGGDSPLITRSKRSSVATPTKSKLTSESEADCAALTDDALDTEPTRCS